MKRSDKPGRVAVNDSLRQGSAQLMLRPEQLQVAQVATDVAGQGADPGVCYGAVLDTDFGGAVSVLTVRLLGGSTSSQTAVTAASAQEPLLVHSPGLHAPPVGALVRITVAGQAHVFSA